MSTELSLLLMSCLLVAALLVAVYYYYNLVKTLTLEIDKQKITIALLAQQLRKYIAPMTSTELDALYAKQPLHKQPND